MGKDTSSEYITVAGLRMNFLPFKQGLDCNLCFQKLL